MSISAPISSATPRVVIIGGGFAGAVTALHLVLQTSTPLDLTVIEPSSHLGRGIAYATREGEHVVNGLAGSFALDAAKPDRFLAWLQGKVSEGAWSPPDGEALASSSPPRALYGAYIASELEAALRNAAGRVRFSHERGRAVDFDGTTVTLGSGKHIPADIVVLATGLHRREPSLGDGLTDHPRYVRNVFDPTAFADVGQASHILILGSGLTMLDTLISAERRGFRGRYTVLSRRGLLVEPRREAVPWPGSLNADDLPATALEVMRWIRKERRAIREAGADWQRLPPLFRAHTSPIWAALDNHDRARLLKRLVPFWNLSQHRAAPSSYAWLERVRQDGRLTAFAGVVTALEVDGDGLRVQVRPRGESRPRPYSADIVASALGYEFDWTRIDEPLVRGLLGRGIVSSHPLKLGIEADPASLAVIGRDGRVSRSVFAIGHPLRGALWESSSIREQLDQAQRLAGYLTTHFEQNAHLDPAA